MLQQGTLTTSNRQTGGSQNFCGLFYWTLIALMKSNLLYNPCMYSLSSKMVIIIS